MSREPDGKIAPVRGGEYRDKHDAMGRVKIDQG